MANFEFVPKTEEKLTPEEFLNLTKNNPDFTNIKSVEFFIDGDNPKDFGSFKVSYEDPVFEVDECMMEM